MSQADLTAAPVRTPGAVLGAPAAWVRPAHGFDLLYVQRPRRWLLLILAAFLLCATLFALITPAWQAPDEPAHYNYIAHIAATGSLPVLRMGDYDQNLLGLLLANGFAPATLVERLRYESYQPPLFYLSAAPVFWATGGSLTALRFYNVLLGFIALILLYLCLELVFPNKPLISLGATAFAALLPMHVAVSAAVNNDMLAELLTLGAALVLLHWMHPYYYAPAAPAAHAAHAARLTDAAHRHDRTHLLLLGVLLGLGLLTKIYAYAVLPLFVLIVLWTVWRAQRSWVGLGAGTTRALLVAGPALLLALPLWLRNLAIYGHWDFLGLHWHDTVVAGQPTTAAWIAANGSLAYFERAFSLTFRSFWGVFGWLGVTMDERIYRAALLFTGVLFLGLLWASVRLISGPPDTDMDDFQTTVLGILGLLLLAVAASFVWYNLKFVQHQGRYFFWGMLAIGTVVALGWREVLHPLQGTITGVIAAALAGSLLVSNRMGGAADKWSILAAGAMAVFLLAQPLLLLGTAYGHPWRALQQRLAAPAAQGAAAGVLQTLRFLTWAAPFLLLFVLDLLVPFWYIAPQLTR